MPVWKSRVCCQHKPVTCKGENYFGMSWLHETHLKREISITPCWLLRRTRCVTRTLSSLRWKKNLANLSICCKWKDLTVCETPTKCKSGLTLSPPFMLEAGFSKKCKKKLWRSLGPKTKYQTTLTLWQINFFNHDSKMPKVSCTFSCQCEHPHSHSVGYATDVNVC